eukprot:TRINITY_DN4655_c0_g4_i1.p1 TRINITY_DN4655_c0_g4~~TRINITY_DN4655_c0_g4_i1.p1  ORF type:complete len:189 (-),score=33.19 TRINITY_DN4655_c0_g4_i1:116-682(-)
MGILEASSLATPILEKLCSNDKFKFLSPAAMKTLSSSQLKVLRLPPNKKTLLCREQANHITPTQMGYLTEAVRNSVYASHEPCPPPSYSDDYPTKHHSSSSSTSSSSSSASKSSSRHSSSSTSRSSHSSSNKDTHIHLSVILVCCAGMTALLVVLLMIRFYSHKEESVILGDDLITSNPTPYTALDDV